MVGGDLSPRACVLWHEYSHVGETGGQCHRTLRTSLLTGPDFKLKRRKYETFIYADTDLKHRHVRSDQCEKFDDHIFAELCKNPG